MIEVKLSTHRTVGEQYIESAECWESDIQDLFQTIVRGAIDKFHVLRRYAERNTDYRLEIYYELDLIYYETKDGVHSDDTDGDPVGYVTSSNSSPAHEPKPTAAV